MNMLEITLKADRRFEVGGLSVFPLTSTKSGDLAILTGPEAFDAGLIEVDELDPPEVTSLAVTNLADVPVLLVEGEMLLGGDQDRSMNVTVLCAAGSRRSSRSPASRRAAGARTPGETWSARAGMLPDPCGRRRH